MVVGFLIPKAILFAGISLRMLLAGAFAATLWSLAVFWIARARSGKINVFAVLAVIMIVARVIVILASKSPALYLFAQALESAFYGAAFFLSLLLPRSFIQLFAEASGARVPESIRASVYYHRAWNIITAVWAGVYMLTALVLVTVRMSSLKSVAIVDMLANWPITIGLIAFTVLFPRWYWTKKLGGIPSQ